MMGLFKKVRERREREKRETPKALPVIRWARLESENWKQRTRRHQGPLCTSPLCQISLALPLDPLRAGSVPKISVFPSGISVSGLKILPYEHPTLEVMVARENGARAGAPAGFLAREGRRPLLPNTCYAGYFSPVTGMKATWTLAARIASSCIAHCIFHIISILFNCTDTVITGFQCHAIQNRSK